MPFMYPKYDSKGNPTAQQPTSAYKQMQLGDNPGSYEQFYKDYTGYGVNPYGLAGRIDNFFTGKQTASAEEYQRYLEAYNARIANEQTWAREDSQIQRLMADYKAAGLNPYLLMSGGNLSSGVVSSQAYRRKSPGNSAKSNNSGKKEVSAITSAIKAIAFIAMMAG